MLPFLVAPPLLLGKEDATQRLRTSELVKVFDQTMWNQPFLLRDFDRCCPKSKVTYSISAFLLLPSSSNCTMSFPLPTTCHREEHHLPALSLFSEKEYSQSRAQRKWPAQSNLQRREKGEDQCQLAKSIKTKVNPSQFKAWGRATRNEKNAQRKE